MTTATPSAKDLERAREYRPCSPIPCIAFSNGPRVCEKHASIAQALSEERERAAKMMDDRAAEHEAIAVERRDDDMEMATTHKSIAHTYNNAARQIRAGDAA